MEYLDDPRMWSIIDYLRYYTHWSSMYTMDYSDEHDFFTFDMASGESITMFQWFAKSVTYFDDSDINVAKIVASIWTRVHPLS